MKSMTGFATKKFNFETIDFTIEMKGLNHKYLEYKFFMPNFMNPFEMEFSKIITQYFKRGKMDIAFFINKMESNYDIVTNENLALKISRILNQLRKKTKIKRPLYISNITGYEGVIRMVPNFQIHQYQNFFIQGLEEVSKMLAEERIKEGKLLQNHLSEELKNLRINLELILKAKDDENKLILDKIKTKLQTLIDDPKIDEKRLLEESALLTSHIDITEEVTRLSSHLDYLDDLVGNSKGEIGKKIDFLSQEVLREANTICSKAISNSIIYPAIEIKTIVEKIREQARNIE